MNFDVNSLKPLFLENKTTNELFTTHHKNKQYLVKTYSGDNKELRQQTESKRLMLWAKHGLPVPRLYEASINFTVETPYLVMEYIDGHTLKSFLKDPLISIEQKILILEKIFKVNAFRHKLAIQDCDHQLIHHDLNSGNIIINNSVFFYIDFEGSFIATNSIEKIQDKISIEVAKLVRWSAMDMGPNHLAEILESMVRAYSETKIPQFIVNRIQSRSFQFIHRWKDKKKKTKKPQEVTKYDIADALQRVLNLDT